MSITTCNVCGSEYNANRLDEHCCSCVALEAQLAAAQAVNEKLRESLEEIRNCNVFKWLCFEKGSPIDLMLMRIDEALALPSDTTALQQRLAEEREKCAVAAWTHYADVCKRKGLNPHHHGEWIASTTIRGMK